MWVGSFIAYIHSATPRCQASLPFHYKLYSLRSEGGARHLHTRVASKEPDSVRAPNETRRLQSNLYVTTTIGAPSRSHPCKSGSNVSGVLDGWDRHDPLPSFPKHLNVANSSAAVPPVFFSHGLLNALISSRCASFKQLHLMPKPVNPNTARVQKTWQRGSVCRCLPRLSRPLPARSLTQSL